MATLVASMWAILSEARGKIHVAAQHRIGVQRSEKQAGRFDKILFRLAEIAASLAESDQRRSHAESEYRGPYRFPTCNAAFAPALQDLQNNAKAAGGNAVVNIASYYKNGSPLSGVTEFECHAGSHTAGLSLKGDIVKTAYK